MSWFWLPVISSINATRAGWAHLRYVRWCLSLCLGAVSSSNRSLDGCLVQHDGRVKGIRHWVSSFVGLFVLSVIPVPVSAFVAPLILAFFIVVLFSIGFVFIFIFTFLTFFFIFSRRLIFYLFWGLDCFFGRLFFFFFFFRIILFFIVLFFPVLSRCVFLSKCLTRQIWTEFLNHWVPWESSEELLLKTLCRYVVLLLELH